MSNHDTLLTTTQAGALLGKSGRTVARLAESGALPPVHKLPGPNGALLFRREDVDAYAAEQAAKAADLASTA